MKKLPFTDCVHIVGTAVKKFDGTKKYISTGALDCDHIDDSEVEEVSYDNKPSRANLIAHAGDILFAKMQGTKKTLVLDAETEKHIYSTGFCAIRPKDGVITGGCLYHLISSDDFLRKKDQNCSGATQKAITNNGLQKIIISIPDIAKQPKIAERLDLIDHATNICHNILKSLDQIVKSRFVEMFGDPENNPMDWIKVPMGNHITTLVDFNANGSYAYLDSNVIMYDHPDFALMVRTTDLEKNDFEHDVKYIDENAYNILSKSKVYGNEIIMNKIGSAGKVYLMPCLHRPVSLGRNAFMFRFDNEINVVFLFHQLTSAYGEKEIMQHVRGAVTKTITKDAARSVRIIVPPKPLQDDFESFVHDIDKSKLAVKECLEKTEYLKSALMQEYFG